MPLTARTKDGEIIYAPTFESGYEIRLKFPNRGDLISPFPDCDIPVFPRDPAHKILHFFHASKPETRYAYHPESIDHIIGKLLLKKRYEQEIKERSMTGYRVELEKPIGDRIADVAIVSGNGDTHWVAECQLSPITPKELEERTADYEQHGADVRWMLGGAAHTDINQNWCFDRIGTVWVYSSDRPFGAKTKTDLL